MERDLSLGLRLKLRVHYLMCSFCERYAKQLRYMRTVAREFPEKIGDIAKEKLPDNAKARMRAVVAGIADPGRSNSGDA